MNEIVKVLNQYCGNEYNRDDLIENIKTAIDMMPATLSDLDILEAFSILHFRAGDDYKGEDFISGFDYNARIIFVGNKGKEARFVGFINNEPTTIIIRVTDFGEFIVE